MPRRTIEVNGATWEIYPSGHATVYGKDQFGLVFEQGSGPERRRRFTRYSPIGSRSQDRAFAELSDAQLAELLHTSQPAWTAPEAAYGAR